MRLWTLLTTILGVAALSGCGGTTSTPPAKEVPATAAKGEADDVAAERAKLPAEDRALVDAQEWCAVSNDERLGSMGAPIKLDIQGQAVFVCCKGCVRKAEADPEKTLKIVAELKAKKAAAPAK
jgi:hypothetical protein